MLLRSDLDERVTDLDALVRSTIPPDARVLVVSRGDDALLGGGRWQGAHFPQAADGTWPGYHPGSSGEAIAELERHRAAGAAYLAFPADGLWWLEFYGELREHLDERYAITAFVRGVGLVYDLAPAGEERAVLASGRTPGTPIKRKRRATRPTEPAPLELTRDRSLTYEYAASAGRTHLLRGEIVGTDERHPRAAVASIRFLDADGDDVPGPYAHLTQSPREDIGWYRYVEASGMGSSPFLVALEPPPAAARVQVSLRKWDRRVRDRLFLRGEPAFGATDAQLLAEEVARSPDDVRLLRLLARLQKAEGALTAHIDTMRRVVELAPSEDLRAALARVEGARRELDTAWRPEVPGTERLARRDGPIRICHLFKVSYPFESSGGAVRNINIVRSQRESGLDPYVITPLGYPSTHGIERVEPETTIAGVPHVRLPLPGDDGSLPADRRLEYDTLVTAGVVRDRGADLIHAASGYRGYELALKGIALARHFHLPLIYEVRSLHEHLWGRGGNDLDSEWTRLRIAQENRCMDDADVVVTLAESMRELLCRRGVPAEKIVVVPNAVDETAFVPAPSDEALKARLGLGHSTVVGYISNVSAREGHAVLIKAFAALSRQRPDVRCLIVGDGPERAAVEALASALGVRDRVVFTGEIDHAEVRSYYSIIDVFVVPRLADYASDHVTPLKPYEALALERAMIVSDRPSLREIVGDDRFGRIFRTGDVEHLVARMRELVDRPDLRAELGQRGRRWILQERTWRSNATRYRNLYEQLLSEPRREVSGG